METHIWQLYQLVWAIFAICLGGFGVFYMDLFIKFNVKLYRVLFDKTGFSVFRYYADNMNSTSVRLTAYIVAVMLIVLGTKLLLWH
jgi:hypothetical protein